MPLPHDNPDRAENDSDANLLRRAIAGDESAFVELYERLKGGIYRYALYITNSRATADEVTQEVFISLLKRGGDYREDRGDVGGFGHVGNDRMQFGGRMYRVPVKIVCSGAVKAFIDQVGILQRADRDDGETVGGR